jgi:hypothetical protein
MLLLPPLFQVGEQRAQPLGILSKLTERNVALVAEQVSALTRRVIMIGVQGTIRRLLARGALVTLGGALRSVLFKRESGAASPPAPRIHFVALFATLAVLGMGNSFAAVDAQPGGYTRVSGTLGSVKASLAAPMVGRPDAAALASPGFYVPHALSVDQVAASRAKLEAFDAFGSASTATGRRVLLTERPTSTGGAKGPLLRSYADAAFGAKRSIHGCDSTTNLGWQPPRGEVLTDWGKD